MRFATRLMAAACALVASVAAGVVGGGGAAHAATLKVEIRNAGTGKCVTAAVPGPAVVQRSCSLGPGQDWNVLGVPLDGSPGQLVNVDTGKCLDVQSFTNGGAVVQIDCAGQPFGSFWSYARVGTTTNGTVLYRLKHATTNFCLDLENGLPDEDLSLQVWQCNTSTNNQRWFNTVIFA